MTLLWAISAHFLCSELNRSMNVEISNPLKAQKSTEAGQLPFTIDHELLIKTLQEAINRSIQHQRSILASFTQKDEGHDTLQAFSRSRLARLANEPLFSHT